MNKFNEWYTKINEELAEPVAVPGGEQATEIATAGVADNRDAMISDIDTIMTSLETLAGELKEELELTEEEEVSESELGAMAAAGAAAAVGVGFAAKFAMNKIKSAKAKKAQQKINDSKMKIELLKLKASEAENAEAKKAILDRAKQMADNISKLETATAEKYANSDMATRALAIAKAEGDMERYSFLSKQEGGEKYKSKLNDLKKKHSKAISEFDKIKKEAEEKAKKSEEESPAETPAETSADAEETKEPVDKNSKEGKLDRLNALLKAAEESGDENKIKKVKDLIDRVSAKESWQLNNTALGQLLEAEIIKLENEQLLNESITLSIKERFSKLI